MKKFTVVLLAIMFAATSLLAACSSTTEKKNDGQGQSKTAQSDQKKVVKFWMRGAATTLLSKNFVEDVKAYEEKNPNIKIEYEFIDYNDVTVKWNTAFAGGTAPDIFETGIIDIASHANLKQFLPLDDYINNWSEKNDTMDVFYELGKFKGKIYGLGYQPFPIIFVWRKDYFEQAGLDPNRPPKDWAELKQYAQKLVKKEGNTVVRSGLDVPSQTGDKQFMIYSRQNGCKFVDEANDLPLIDMPECVEALNFMVDLSQHSVPFDSSKPDKLPFKLGNAAMAYMSPELGDMIKANPSLKDKIGYAPYVPGKVPFTFNGMRLYSVSSASKVKDESWEFVKFLVSKERQAKRMKDTLTSASLKSLEDDFIKMDPESNRAIMEAIKVGKGNPSVTWSPLYEKYTRLAYEQAIFKQKTAEQALQEAVKKLKEEIRK